MTKNVLTLLPSHSLHSAFAVMLKNKVSRVTLHILLGIIFTIYLYTRYILSESERERYFHFIGSRIISTNLLLFIDDDDITIL